MASPDHPSKSANFDAELDSIFSHSYAPLQKAHLPKPASSSTTTKSHSQPTSSPKASNKSTKPTHPKLTIPSLSKKPNRRKSRPEEQVDSDDHAQLEELYVAQAVAKRLKQSHTHRSDQPRPSAKGAAKCPPVAAQNQSGTQVEVSESAEEDSHSAEEDSDRGESHSEQHSDADSDEQDIPSPASTPTATSTSPEPHRRLPLSSQSKKQLKAIQTAQSPRTVFVGNVPLASALTRPARKAFKRFIQQQLHDLPHESNTDPDARKIESYRFRSLPLDVSGAKDTNELATNAHSNQRGQQWRSQGFRKRKAGTVEDEEFDAAAKQSKVFLSAQQKRKVAYITGGQGKSKEGAQEAEKGGGSCSAYIVLANPHLVQPLAAALDGASFDGRTLRSDTVDAEKKQNMDKSEERRTLFIGGLPYSESEEGVRTFVEQLLANSAKGSSQSPAMSSWVKRVRMVRDPATGAGKGIAYVLLHDTDCVDELLSIDASRRKMQKLKLRFERCKSTRHQQLKTAALPTRSDKASRRDRHSSKSSTASEPKRAERGVKPAPRPVSVPTKAEKEAFGARLASLSKEDRKEVKKADADRVARRLQKKFSKAKASGQSGHSSTKSRIKRLPEGRKRPKGASAGREKRSQLQNSN